MFVFIMYGFRLKHYLYKNNITKLYYYMFVFTKYEFRLKQLHTFQPNC